MDYLRHDLRDALDEAHPEVVQASGAATAQIGSVFIFRRLMLSLSRAHVKPDTPRTCTVLSSSSAQHPPRAAASRGRDGVLEMQVPPGSRKQAAVLWALQSVALLQQGVCQSGLAGAHPRVTACAEYATGHSPDTKRGEVRAKTLTNRSVRR
jgi:hypothetical protein